GETLAATPAGGLLTEVRSESPALQSLAESNELIPCRRWARPTRARDVPTNRSHPSAPTDPVRFHEGSGCISHAVATAAAATAPSASQRSPNHTASTTYA